MAIDADIARAVLRLAAVRDSAVPKAAAQAVNKIAARASSRALRATAKEVGVTVKTLRPRARMLRANNKRPSALLIVRRRPLPMIAAGAVRQLKRGGMLQVGKHRLNGAFVADGSKGFGPWTGHGYGQTNLKSAQVLRRTGKGRYPLEVVTIPLLQPLTKHYQEQARSLMTTDMPDELRRTLRRQLELATR